MNQEELKKYEEQLSITTADDFVKERQLLTKEYESSAEIIQQNILKQFFLIYGKGNEGEGGILHEMEKGMNDPILRQMKEFQQVKNFLDQTRRLDHLRESLIELQKKTIKKMEVLFQESSKKLTRLPVVQEIPETTKPNMEVGQVEMTIRQKKALIALLSLEPTGAYRMGKKIGVSPTTAATELKALREMDLAQTDDRGNRLTDKGREFAQKLV